VKRAAVRNMLEMQSRMNSRVHEHWIDQDFAWYRAVWIECGELMDHVGYKWWKKQEPDMDQVLLEVVDIWHFGMSALFKTEPDLDALADKITADLLTEENRDADIHEATESLAQHALQSKSFSVPYFAVLMRACGLTLEALYQQYVGKNVLNFFRQDNGYQEGTYIKLWGGREDNEHLVEVLATLDDTATDYPELVYRALAERYREAL
jgi:dimeric dUTPase (all-alpha-NTP-PPase superfamily)